MKPYPNISDQELIIRLKEGDRQAFNQIYYRYSEVLYRFAFNILKDRDECKDTVQEIFIWLWQNRDTLDIKILRNYLFAAVKFKLASVVQRSKRRAIILQESPKIRHYVIDDALEIKELKEVISQFLNTLPPKARDIFRLSRNEYLSNKEIADSLGISEKTVENQITISLKKLRVTLGRNSLLSIFL